MFIKGSSALAGLFLYRTFAVYEGTRFVVF